MSEFNPPLVCICIPTYNVEKTIQETLVSIINQSHANLIIKVVDNASTDRTLEIAAALSDPRISIHRHDKNVGGEGNFNRCIQLAQGKYTAIYHADDVYHPQMVERQVSVLERNPKVGGVFTEATLIDCVGNAVGRIVVSDPTRPADGLFDFPMLFKSILKYSNYLICPSAMVRTDIYQGEIMRWREELFGSSSDIDVWLRIAQSHLVAVLYLPLIQYRISAAQESNSLIRLRTGRTEFFRVLDYYLALPQVRAILNSEDVMHYRWLEQTDRVVRATNLFMLGRFDEASALIRLMNFSEALRAAVVSRRGFFTLLAGVYLSIVSFLGLHKFGRFTLRYLRRIIRK